MFYPVCMIIGLLVRQSYLSIHKHLKSIISPYHLHHNLHHHQNHHNHHLHHQPHHHFHHQLTFTTTFTTHYHLHLQQHLHLILWLISFSACFYFKCKFSGCSSKKEEKLLLIALIMIQFKLYKVTIATVNEKDLHILN